MEVLGADVAETTYSLIVATELSPTSVLARLTPYVAGSGSICIYSPYQQVLAEVLQYSKKDPNYLNSTLSESWSRTYQVSYSNKSAEVLG